MRALRNNRAAKVCAAATAATLLATQVRAALPDELVCGFENVEDMVALPGTTWIIGSGIGDSFFQKGGLHLFNEETATGRKVVLEMQRGAAAQPAFAQCPGAPDPEKFSAHGLSLKANADGTHDLYVVNHGGRESIEVFRVTAEAEGAPEITWIGCVMTPDTAMPNAVAARPDGSLVMSASFVAETRVPPMAEIAASGLVMTREQAAEASKAMKYGALFTWSREAGWKKVPGSELLGNNGIELGLDGKWAFVDSHPGASVTYMPLAPGLGKAREIKLDFHPDNIRLGYDGKLIVTGHLASPEVVGGCVVANDPHCAIDYRAAEIDPRTLAVKQIFDGTGTRSFGIATVGLRTQHSLWLGPVRGQCVARVNSAAIR